MDARSLAKKYFSKRVDIDEHHGCGAYGRYMRLSSRYGAKILVLESGYSIDFKRFNTVKELRKSSIWKAACDEVKCLNKARSMISRKCMVPICYGIAPVKVILSPTQDDNLFGDRVTSWLPAIFMEHIDGKLLSEHTEFDDDYIYKLEQYLDLHGIENTDIHDQNVIIRPRKTKHKTRFVVIDWTSENVSFNETDVPDFI